MICVMSQVFHRPDRSVDRFVADPTRSYTLPATYYVEPEILEREKRTVFAESWVWVGHRSEVATAGQYLTAEIADQRVFVIRSADGELRAFFNVCMHRGHSLLEGSGTVSSLITCPYHAWAYDSTGALKGARMSDRMDEFDYDEFQLPAVAVEEFCGFVFVNLSTEPAPMAEAYPGLEAALRDRWDDLELLEKVDEVEFTIAANWKNVGDNLLECYHCHPAHPAFVDLIDMDTYVNETHDNWSIQAGASRPENSAYAVASGAQEFASIFAWPNVSLGRLPGTAGLFVFKFTPTGPEETLQTFTLYAKPGEGTDETTTAAMTYFEEVLGPEDVALVENVQKGLRSMGYHQGRFICIPDRPEISEHAVHHFHAMVLNALTPS